MKLLGLLAAVLLLAAAAYWWTGREHEVVAGALRTASLVRTDIVSTITATGTVEPEEVVDVGAQVAGMVVAFGEDENGRAIDYGSQVKTGTVLARIDSALYASDVAQARAQLASAEAGVRVAKANLEQSHAKLQQAAADWTRAVELDKSEVLSQADLDSSKAAHEVARANVGVSEAAIGQAEGAVQVAQAALARADRNLDYCTIKSPVDGVVIDRRVNIGQTVVSSLNAPSLFLIAKDLRRIRVWVAVNEADVGAIRPGQRATFTVDAFPGTTFHGTVDKIRLNASMTQNVVTYTVELATDNAGGLLLPYLTAYVTFEIDRHDDVLAVPDAALRYKPGPGRVAPGAAVRPPADGGAVLWVPAGDSVRPLVVKLGLGDGAATEVSGEGLTEGMPIVVGEQSRDAAPPLDTLSPFTPQLRRGGQRSGTGGGSHG